MRTFIISLCMFAAACGGTSETVQPERTSFYASLWAKHPDPVIVPTQPWEGRNIEDGSVVRVGDTYYRFYCAGDDHFDIGYATSDPAHFPVAWTKYANNPVIRASDLGGVAVCAPRVIQMPDGSFRMYVHAYNGVHDRGFLFASSASDFPNIWTLANGGNPVFVEGGAGQWDSHQIQTQAIIPPWDSPDGLWHMFYIGFNNITFRGGHATSPDGIAWTRDPANPVMTPDKGWKSQHVGPLSWFKRGSKYYLTAQGHDGYAWTLGYYVSENLYDLQSSENPVLDGSPDAWDSSGIEGSDIFRDSDGSLWAFYLGSNVPNGVRGGNEYSAGVARVPD